MVICDYCNEEITQANNGAVVIHGPGEQPAPLLNIPGFDLHPECRRPFRREARKIQGARPVEEPTPNTSREVTP